MTLDDFCKSLTEEKRVEPTRIKKGREPVVKFPPVRNIFLEFILTESFFSYQKNPQQ